VTRRRVTDIAASVRARLLAKSRETRRPFLEVLQYFAMERFLARLVASPHSDRFVLKGGLMLLAWRSPSMRPTRDIDFLATIPNDVETATETIRGICSREVEDDGILFDPNSVQGRIIKEDADYGGVRVTFLGHLQKARIHMQVDMGFGDVTIPPPIDLDYPTQLDFDTPRIRGYARETMIAEKFEAMVALGELNSRVRDFFDVWLLSRQFDFQGRSLAAAIEATFRNRGRSLSTRPVALTRQFAADPVK
jgi:hypothetical protein